MRISSIVDIVEGNLVSSPSISFIYDIKTKLNKIHEGDLFIAKNENEINEAIQKGAFAILYDFEMPIVDSEIAWIKVDNTDWAISRLIRYKLSNLELNAFYCDKITFEILSIYIKSNDDEIKLVSNNLSENLYSLNGIDTVHTIICSNQELLDDIYPNNCSFNKNHYEVKNLIEHSLFETSFSSDDQYFPRIKLPSLYINEFLDAYAFLQDREDKEESSDVTRLKKLNYFKPTFIDKYFELIDYGYSNKFILSQLDLRIAKNEIKFLKEKYKYAKTIIITSSQLSEFFNDADFYIDDIHEIKILLKNIKFNALYVIGFDINHIEELVTKNRTKALL